MRAIDLDEAIERFLQAGNMSKDQVIYMLNRIPTTEIVRCEDCKYKGKVGDVSVCRIHEISTREGDYCSRGERSERMADRPCKFAINTSGDCWECGCFLDTYCEHQIYDRNPDGTLNIVKCGERREE